MHPYRNVHNNICKLAALKSSEVACMLRLILLLNKNLSKLPRLDTFRNFLIENATPLFDNIII